MQLITTTMRRTVGFTAVVAAVLSLAGFGLAHATSNPAAPYAVAHVNTK